MPFSYFPSPFVPQLSQVPTGTYTHKRKHYSSSDEDVEQAGENFEAGDGTVSDHQLPPEAALASLPTDVSTQYRVAGQPFNQEPPGTGFPHRRAANIQTILPVAPTPVRLRQELANLKPPLSSNNKEHQLRQPLHSSFKQTHLSNLVTLMHRCLLRGDYIRAGQAFGNLLRTESGGQHVDIRGQHLWGIGVEILLQSKAQKQKGFGDVAQSMSQGTEIARANEEGFELAKQYFERLIIEYPYRGWNSQSLSALHFYPLMFSHWIAFIDEQNKLAKAPFLSRGNSSSASEEDSDIASDIPTSKNDEREAIRMKTLEKANELTKRMDDVLQSFPYSEDATLWQLRGNTHLWIADLSIPLDNRNVSPDHQETRSQERKQQLQDAEEAFSRAKRCIKDSFGILAQSHSQSVDQPV